MMHSLFADFSTQKARSKKVSNNSEKPIRYIKLYYMYSQRKNKKRKFFIINIEKITVDGHYSFETVS